MPAHHLAARSPAPHQNSALMSATPCSRTSWMVPRVKEVGGVTMDSAKVRA